MHVLAVAAAGRGWLAGVLLLATLSVPAPAAADLGMEGRWTAGQSAGQAPDWRPFDPARLQAFPRDPDGALVELRPADGRWPDPPRVLVVRHPPLGAITLLDADGSPQRGALNEPADTALPAHGRIAFRIAHLPAAGQPLRLRIEPYPAVSAPMAFAVTTERAFQREDARWLAFVSACFGIMLAMALMGLVFAAILRDFTLVLYAGYVLGYLVVQAIQSGYAVQPLGIAAVAAAPLLWGRFAVGLAVGCAAAFLARFANLRRYAPRLARALHAYGIGMVVVSALAMLPLPALQAAARAIVNPALLAGTLLMLAAGALGAWRGSRYALLFLAGWAPLLVLTAVDSAQVSGALPGVLWINDACIAAAAFEAVVLSIGLAHRALDLRRDLDYARTLADADPYTGVLNRRAWTERLQLRLRESARTAQPLCVLFLDLDHFKSLNDNFGHHAGDDALLAFAAALRDPQLPQAEIGRYGGEEFTVLLPDCGFVDALRYAERVREQLRRMRVVVDPGGRPLTVSIGIAARAPGEDVTTLIARADAAMYAAKTAGRDCVMLAGEAAPVPAAR